MKKLISGIALVLLVGSSLAQQVTVQREALGSGSPELSGVEHATVWSNDIYHAPQYMPGFPTAATIWPRVVDVKCVKTTDGLNCDGYHWIPELGRGEYLMIHPVVSVAEPVQVITNTVHTIVYKEVPIKKIGE